MTVTGPVPAPRAPPPPPMLPPAPPFPPAPLKVPPAPPPLVPLALLGGVPALQPVEGSAPAPIDSAGRRWLPTSIEPARGTLIEVAATRTSGLVPIARSGWAMVMVSAAITQ